MRIVKSTIFASALLIASGCAITTERLGTSEYHAALLWQDEALELIKKYQLNPLRASRVLAYLHKGMDETSTEAKRRSQRADCVVSAVDHVASRTLDYFFPLETAGRLVAKAELRRNRSGDCVTGLHAANQVFIDTRSGSERDGALPPRRLRANSAPKVGSWQATPPVFIVNPAEPFAGEWKPFFVSRPAELTIAPPLDPSSAAYRVATFEVLEVAKQLTAAEQRTAEFWHLDAGSITPSGIWNLKLRDLLKENADPHADSLRLLAALNMAMYDAMVTCWHYKYAFWTERPITAAERLGLGAWTPMLVTPPFPSYPSGHATVSGAAAEVIAAYLPAHADTVRKWAAEAAMSRLWGGIHFRFDNDEGLALGRQVGSTANARMPPR